MTVANMTNPKATDSCVYEEVYLQHVLVPAACAFNDFR